MPLELIRERVAQAPAAPEDAWDDAARSRTDRFTALDLAMASSVLISVVGNIISAKLALGWYTAVALDIIQVTYLLALARQLAWRGLLGRLFLAGFVAGVVELFTDVAGEHVVHSLSYPPGEPLLWSSPVYMPLAWALVLTQLGYLGWRLRGLAPRLPVWASCLLVGGAGALLVPFYEEMAYYAGWWQYAAAPRIGHTPLYVMLFEGAVTAVLPLLLFHLERRRLSYAVAVGALLGLWMPWAALDSWLLLGR